MFAAALAGSLVLGAAGCGEDQEADQVDTRQGAVVTWTNLQLLNGWQSYGTGYTPQVAIIDGATVFKGALKGPNATSDIAFRLDGTFTQFRTQPQPEMVSMRTVMSTNNTKYGTIWVQAYTDPQTYQVLQPVHVVQDGVTYGGIGAEARAFTSLDGVAFDQSPGPGLAFNENAWTSMYGFRQQDDFQCTGLNDCGVYAKLVNGFVRFQGALQTPFIEAFDGYVMTLTNSTLIPGQMVTVPVSLGPASSFEQHMGELSIYPNGNVFLNGSSNGALAGLVFDGTMFSKTNSGQTLPLASGWVAYSPRQVRVGNFNGVVRFQGAIKNGTSAQIATVPTGLRPSRTVKVEGDIVVGAAWPITIIIEPTGFMWFQGAPVNYAATHLSLDGISYPL